MPPSLHRNTALQLLLSAAFLLGVHAGGLAAWPRLLEFFGSGRSLFGWGSLILHMGLLLSLNGALAVLYACRFPAVEACKISSAPWPWLSPDAAVRARFAAATRGAIASVLFNNLVIALPNAFLAADVGARIGALRTDVASFPSLATLVWQVAACALVEDAMFYWTHRSLHASPLLYRWVHKWHHVFHHSIGIASENAHPLEFLLGNLVPVMAGAMLTRAHAFTFFVWLTVRIFETVDAHSGYEFPWTPARLLPFAIAASHHDFHHSSNVGCFGSQFRFWDWLCGTDQAFNSSAEKSAAKEAAAAAVAGGEPPPASGDGAPSARRRAKAA